MSSSVSRTIALFAAVCLTMPSAAASPNAETKPYLVEGFESADWWQAWKLKKIPRNCTVVSRDDAQGLRSAHSGNKALRIHVEKDGHYGTSLDYMFQKVRGKEPESIHFRYYLYLGKDWNYWGKMPGFGGTYNKEGWGGKPSDGTKGWSARGSGHSGKNGFQMSTYCYHADMKGKYGNVWKWPGAILAKSRWYCVEQYCRMNTPGENNGIIRAWVDGKKVFEKTDIRMRHNPKLKIEKIWFNIYYGGKPAAPAECFLYIDDIVIADHYIGPNK